MSGCVIITLLLLIQIVIGDNSIDDETVIKQLIGEPDYKSVKLHWLSEMLNNNNNNNNHNNEDSYGFLVRYCELQSWGAQRCRTRQVNEPDNNSIDTEENSLPYTVNINGLRMATTYSFEIKPVKSNNNNSNNNNNGGKRENRAETDKNENVIVIPTKGFSARATQCLPHASEIEVSTGPFFGGRIAVESSDGEKCAIDGEPNSPRDTYILRINHTECGSQVNETTVATFVLVQENLPILTHSTRRFLVLCSYQPETLTVRAGINLPTNKNTNAGHASIAYDYEAIGGNRRARNMRNNNNDNNRLLIQKPEALVTDDKAVLQEVHIRKGNPIPIIAATFVIMIGIVALIMLIIRWNLRRITNDLDNVSISSNGTDYSTSSSTNIKIENEVRLTNTPRHDEI